MSTRRKKATAAHSDDSPKHVLNEVEAARYINMSVSYLRKSRMEGDRKSRTPGPAWVKIGRSIGYLKTDLDAWLQAHRVEPKKAAI